MPTLNLGSNLYINCGSAVTLAGLDIFNLRSGANNDQLLCDFDILAKDDTKIAVIRKNQVVYAASGYTMETGQKEVIIKEPDGSVFATAKATALDAVSITGTFWHKGRCCVIEENQMSVGGIIMRAGKFLNCGTGISVG